MKLILFIFFASVASAQETIHLGSVSGRVTDPSGAIVESARVTVRQTETNISAAMDTDGEGRFRFPYLKLGPYEIKVHREGFADVVRLVSIRAGAAYELPVELRLQVTKADANVEANAVVLEGARSQIAGTVWQAEVRSLPLNGRNFLDLALLTPGVSPTNTASTQLFAETSAVPGQGISVGSQRNLSNNFVVDGLSANDDAAGLSGMFYGLDTVQEFQVVTSGAQAELGRALGGYLNVVTRSGTNTVHGSVYGYLKNERFNAANPLLRQKLPLTQTQYGASLGGPIVQDRTFYFTNFEQRLLNQSGLATISAANVTAINSRLDATGFQGPRISTGLYPNPVHNVTYLGKLDHQFNGNDQFNIRYSLYDVDSRNSRGAGALSAPSASAALDNRDQTIAASNIWALSSRTVNETRGQFTYSDLSAPPTDLTGPAVSIAGVATFGRSSGSPTGRFNKLYQLVDNFSHQSGAHALRGGVDFLYNNTTITYPRSIRGSYSFSSLANFLNGVYNNAGFTQTFGNSTVHQGNPNLGLYAQDEWKISSRLTMNLGLRYDLQFLETVDTDTNNFAPRVGLAWTPLASRRTVIRGSYGLFYDRVPLRALANALLSAGNTTTLNSSSQVSVSLSPTQTGAPVFPNVLTATPALSLLNFTTMDRNLQNAYSQQTSFEVEQQLGTRSTVSIGYQRLRGLHLLMSINQNVPTCVASGNNNGCRPNPAYANNSQYSSLGDSHYDGLHLSFVQRPAKWGHYRVSYTYSKSMNNLGEFFFSGPIDQFNVWRDYARSDDDQRHRFVFDGSLRAPFGFELGGLIQYYSSLPFNITAGSTTVQGTTARPIVNGDYISRNAGAGFDFLNVSGRVSRVFPLGERLKLETIAEGFNLLNRVNGVTLNGVFGAGAYPTNPSATFRQTTAVADMRSFQIALRATF